jgi:hypothetical protein
VVRVIVGQAEAEGSALVRERGEEMRDARGLLHSV